MPKCIQERLRQVMNQKYQELTVSKSYCALKNIGGGGEREAKRMYLQCAESPIQYSLHMLIHKMAHQPHCHKP